MLGKRGGSCLVCDANDCSDVCFRLFRSYIGTISEVYFFVIFVEIYTNAMSLCAVIFCYLTIDWTNLYFVLALTLTKLFAFCLLGTMVEITVCVFVCFFCSSLLYERYLFVGACRPTACWTRCCRATGTSCPSTCS